MDTHSLITKRDARAMGLKRYFLGTVCRNGHQSERFVSDGGCVDCRHDKVRATREAEKARNPRPQHTPMTAAQHTQRWRERHPESVAAYKKMVQESGKQREYSRRYYERHPEMSGNWARNNPALARERSMRYMAKLRAVSVSWADKSKIEAFYLEAHRLTVETGIPYEVDHIFPLHGKTVTGLHHELNLRVVTRFENRSKGNRLIVGV